MDLSEEYLQQVVFVFNLLVDNCESFKRTDHASHLEFFIFSFGNCYKAICRSVRVYASTKRTTSLMICLYNLSNHMMLDDNWNHTFNTITALKQKYRNNDVLEYIDKIDVAVHRLRDMTLTYQEMYRLWTQKMDLKSELRLTSSELKSVKQQLLETQEEFEEFKQWHTQNPDSINLTSLLAQLRTHAGKNNKVP
jgi:hypothetical protein